MNKEALLKVAQACRESPDPEHFTMSRHMHPCGTPACAFGHYAARTDLQEAFRLRSPQDFLEGKRVLSACDGVETVAGYGLSFDDPLVAAHFGIEDMDDLNDLFGSCGCGDARTPIAAAEFIEQWVKDNEDTP